MNTVFSKPLRVGIVGAGANTRERHIPGFQSLKDVELVSVANRSRESGEKVARMFGIPKVADHWKAVVEDPQIDAICIGTWPDLHAEITLAALAAGKHVLTEARMAMDLGEARRMLSAARAHPSLVTQIVPAPFSFSVDATVQRLIREGRLGALRLTEVSHLTGIYADPATPFTWRQDVTRSGKNMLTMGICHEILQRWLPADMRVKEVTATGMIATTQRMDPESGAPRAVELPEQLLISGRFQDGCRLVEHYSGLHGGVSRLEIVLAGEEATLRADLNTGHLWLARKGADPERVEIPSEELRGWQVETDFVASIREGKPVVLTSFEEGVRYMAFTEAVHTAWKQGGTVAVQS